MAKKMMAAAEQAQLMILGTAGNAGRTHRWSLCLPLCCFLRACWEVACRRHRTDFVQQVALLCAMLATIPQCILTHHKHQYQAFKLAQHQGHKQLKGRCRGNARLIQAVAKPTHSEQGLNVVVVGGGWAGVGPLPLLIAISNETIPRSHLSACVECFMQASARPSTYQSRATMSRCWMPRPTPAGWPPAGARRRAAPWRQASRASGIR